jgi:putative ABC transport system ATP-binding protein
MKSPSLIHISQLEKTYSSGLAQELPALRGVGFDVYPGEFLAIMGPSGSGKSTLMNILGCLDIPTGGQYLLGGRDTAGLSVDELARLRNRTIGFVFQGFNLLARMDLLDNVALPLIYAGVGKRERRRRAMAMLERVGLASHATHWPNQISGGQQQRVAIARALVSDPQLILADEPTGNLDTQTSEEIMNILTRLNDDQGITVVLVTHELDIARHAKRLIRIVDGRIAFDGPIGDYLQVMRS